MNNEIRQPRVSGQRKKVRGRVLSRVAAFQDSLAQRARNGERPKASAESASQPHPIARRNWRRVRTRLQRCLGIDEYL